MWLPVDIHKKSAVEGGIVKSFLSHLAEGKFYYLVENRNVVNNCLDTIGKEAARAVVSNFEKCSICYVGTSRMRACAPFLAATFAEEIGIAYIEHLIDFDPIEESTALGCWSNNKIESLCYLIFRKHENINSIVIPLLLRDETVNNYKVEVKCGRSVVHRA
ncbi:hypothetical protein [Vibrio nigripulchritudo]|uniref:hypothetical protein n=1 Tax=Vibrio nigripulchritudo TaxID=28173 RepID=UPI0003B199B2|nr:hypothetical protein [Vibrio nigripulchritudo]CCN72904.1 hypothetical protein VIBNISFn118_700003 [Vibrio nigripulchritudo SFn118]